ncbi:MAG: single-stranded DNA-binding protein [Gammaproteobacteria bacterium]|jgi:single-strand DNA-binding protein|nr:single-stranded DNA-binding protein [Gammaproteobacteria bacterium]MBT4449501.1 single-stranded DNA-binding protein [Gammaproteobacteria bacterium]MBT7209290.1 single-stranded DNA-binding protein [Gammaproteobacteria bacterium]
MNNFSFTGRLTQDAEMQATSSGLSILKFSVANNTGFGDKQKTNYINCALFGKRAEGQLRNYLKKGQEVAVSGEVNLNQYTKKDGQQGASLECNVNGVDLIGGRNNQVQEQQVAIETSPPTKQNLDIDYLSLSRDGKDNLGDIPF